ncbi:MAG: hypothetical protein EA361_15005 [Bacteroidetes bacterium]|nr:MAG: hypothetical protein EA361_15005 [Bacteroidota bacterium]
MLLRGLPAEMRDANDRLCYLPGIWLLVFVFLLCFFNQGIFRCVGNIFDSLKIDCFPAQDFQAISLTTV